MQKHLAIPTWRADDQSPNMCRFLIIAAVPLITVGIFLACNSSNTPPKNPAAKSTDTINLSAVTHPPQTEVFHEVKQAILLPGTVLDKLGPIADPEQPFNPTDAVNPALPMRQLAAAALSERYCIVSYWQGGIRLYFKTSIFELSGGRAKLIWLSEQQGGFNLRDLKEIVESGRMHNDLKTPEH